MSPSTALRTRREFVARTVTAAAALASSISFAADKSAGPLKAVVIGHTGRGDYGHGLENIFANRKNVRLAAIADPDETGRKRAAEKTGAPRTYGNYREMLKTEQPRLVSVASNGTGGPRAALKALKYPSDRRWIFYPGDDLHLAAAAFALADVDLEHPSL